MERINGFIAAPFTPMHGDGLVNYELIPDYATFYVRNGIDGAFICGTTGEGFSMMPEERMRVAEQWIAHSPAGFKPIIHVGGPGIEESKQLARHAAASGAWGIGTMAPVFFKPSTVEDLITYCAEIAAEAPHLPFYFYHIPAFTGVYLSMVDFLEKAGKVIPNLAGIKYTDENLYEFSRCIQVDNGRFEMLHGRDETFLAGLALGANSGVGGTYNHIMKIYMDIKKAFLDRDMEKAKYLQWKSQKFISVLSKYGGNVNAGKKIMKFMGLDCGPNRLPVHSLSALDEEAMRKELESIGFFDFCNQ